MKIDTSRSKSMSKNIFTFLICLSTLSFAHANEGKSYGYHTNPYSVHRPYRPGYVSMNNYYTRGDYCTRKYGRGLNWALCYAGYLQ